MKSLFVFSAYFCFLICVAYIRESTVIGRKIQSRYFDGFFQLPLTQNRKIYFLFLAPERFDGFYSYSVFMSSSIIGQCPVNINEHCSSKHRVPSVGPQNKKKMEIFSKTGVTILIKFRYLMETVSLNRDFFRKVTVGAH